MLNLNGYGWLYAIHHFNNAAQINLGQTFSKKDWMQGKQDSKILKIYEICNNNAASTQNIAIQRITLALVFMKNGIGKMEVNLNDGKKRNIYTFKLINENKIKK